MIVQFFDPLLTYLGGYEALGRCQTKYTPDTWNLSSSYPTDVDGKGETFRDNGNYAVPTTLAFLGLDFVVDPLALHFVGL